jgi:hypothetical protein
LYTHLDYDIEQTTMAIPLPILLFPIKVLLITIDIIVSGPLFLVIYCVVVVALPCRHYLTRACVCVFVTFLLLRKR